MIERRLETKIVLGNGDIVHRTLLESVLCPKTGEKAELVKRRMLGQVLENPALLLCGTLEFETCTIKYLTDKWVIELKATEHSTET